MKFTALASSSAGNAYLVEADGARPLLIEAGLPIKKLRRLLPCKLTDLAGCLISHHHGDHARAADKLMRSTVHCYASVETWMALGGAPVGPAHDVHHGVPFTVHRWVCAPFSLPHDAAGCMGYLVGAPSGEKLAFACDCAYVPVRFRDLTILAIECNYSEPILADSTAPPEHKARVVKNHMSLERVLATLAANDLTTLRELHLLHLSDAHSDEELFRRTVAEATGKPVYVAPKERTEA